jgi:hypothetical protein
MTQSIHIKCNDAYEGDAGKDDGSELALFHMADGTLAATIFLNDITAKAYGMVSYNFSFSEEGIEELKTFLNNKPKQH